MFLNTIFDPPVTHENAAEYMDKAASASRLRRFSAEDVYRSHDKMLGLKFCLSGESSIFNMPEISLFASDKLFHLEGFTVFNLDSTSYTSRTYEPKYYLLYTYSGHGSLSYCGHDYILGARYCFFIDARQAHRYASYNDSWMFGLYEFAGPLMADFFRQYALNDCYSFADDQQNSLRSALDDMLNLYNHHSTDFDWQVNAAINNILCIILQLSSPQQDSRSIKGDIKFIIQYLDNNYMNNITMDYLASFCGISKSHLSREFKRYTGMSPIDYVLKKRITKASNLLSSTSMSIKEISYEVGFKNENSFLRLFKKINGITAGEYRRQMKDPSIRE